MAHGNICMTACGKYLSTTKSDVHLKRYENMCIIACFKYSYHKSIISMVEFLIVQHLMKIVPRLEDLPSVT